MPVRILLAPRQPDEILAIARSMAPSGFELVVADPGTPAFYEAAGEAGYFLGLARRMGGEFFRAAPRLRLVQLLSAGYDQVDVEAARKAGVPVANNGGANAIAVSEHTILLMLAVMKRLVRLHNEVVAGRWLAASSAGPVHEAAGRILGIVGLGNIGKKVARRAQALDMRIVYQRHRAPDRGRGGRARRALRRARRAPAAGPTWSACTCPSTGARGTSWALASWPSCGRTPSSSTRVAGRWSTRRPFTPPWPGAAWPARAST